MSGIDRARASGLQSDDLFPAVCVGAVLVRFGFGIGSLGVE